MTILNLKSRDAWTREIFGGQSVCCFYCGETVEDIAVHWHGCDGAAGRPVEMVLYPVCATKVGGELIGEARTADRITTGKSLTAGIDPSLLPQGET